MKNLFNSRLNEVIHRTETEIEVKTKQKQKKRHNLTIKPNFSMSSEEAESMISLGLDQTSGNLISNATNTNNKQV